MKYAKALQNQDLNGSSDRDGERGGRGCEQGNRAFIMDVFQKKAVACLDRTMWFWVK